MLDRRCSAANGYPFRSHTFHLGESTIAIRKSGQFRMLGTIARGHCPPSTHSCKHHWLKYVCSSGVGPGCSNAFGRTPWNVWSPTGWPRPPAAGCPPRPQIGKGEPKSRYWGSDLTAGGGAAGVPLIPSPFARRCRFPGSACLTGDLSAV